jgi:hypothetical protein|tara:strand:- start:261 stop:395 length:135 start_codon:yes stop_codon:yes gene_type:complete
MVSEITDKINSFFKKIGYTYFLWRYKKHLKMRIEKNNFGRREEW